MPPENAFIEHVFAADDGLMLYARDYRPDVPNPEAATIVCLPGLTRNSGDFHALAVLLSKDRATPRRIVTLDARGRGRSARDPAGTSYTLPVEAADVGTLLRHLALPPAVFIGTSRGGLVLHLLAASDPTRLRGVVLNDIGPVIERQGLMNIAAYLHAARPYPSLNDAAAALRAVHGARFPALDDEDWNDMAQAIHVEEDGRFVAAYDPAIRAPLASLTPETPLPDLWPLFAGFAGMPLMVIRGEHSDLLSEETVAAMQARHGDCTAVTAAGQGHAPLLHRPDCLAAIRDFVERVERRR
ncbi:alpha/beta fold hydrolase [Ensifer soli]|uniref:alpha/beta fold hydrolase n=1 Tax=Ciceribacter sp. sgz301302 TaxID=3342379 RepID=UPI0035B852EC